MSIVLTNNPNHVAEALARLAYQFQDKPKIAGLITAFVEQTQSLEDSILEVRDGLYIDNAVGVQLDGFGRIVGEDRQGRSDDIYRIALRARMGRNTSEGTPEDVINVFNLLTGSTQTLLAEFAPAVITLTGNSDFSENADLIFTFMQKVVAAGVRVEYIASGSDDPDVLDFGFLGVNNTGGFDDGTDASDAGQFIDLEAS